MTIFLPSRGKSLNKTHFPSRRFLCTANWAGCFSDCVRFRLSSWSSCLCFFLYFGLDGDKGRANFKPRGQEPRYKEGKRAEGDSHPGQATMQKQVTLAPRKKPPICQGRPSWRERGYRPDLRHEEEIKTSFVEKRQEGG